MCGVAQRRWEWERGAETPRPRRPGLSLCLLYTAMSLCQVCRRGMSVSVLYTSLSLLYTAMSLSLLHTLSRRKLRDRADQLYIYIIRMQVLAINIYIVSP